MNPEESIPANELQKTFEVRSCRQSIMKSSKAEPPVSQGAMG
jgi:hypothetical protein